MNESLRNSRNAPSSAGSCLANVHDVAIRTEGGLSGEEPRETSEPYVCAVTHLKITIHATQAPYNVPGRAIHLDDLVIVAERHEVIPVIVFVDRIH